MSRQAGFDYIQQNQTVSVLIIGGGVNGIGTFRDLALQGIDVLLVEMNDFASGASAASSHMVHGGLRYLENSEFRLVKEALTERNRLLHNAPHQVKPLPTTIPIFHWFSGLLNAPLKFLRLRDNPNKRGGIIIKIGLTLYDFFTRRQQGLPGHILTSRKTALEQRAELNPDVVATATYYDAWMPRPEAICMEMIRDAQTAHPNARALNYIKVISASYNTVTLQDAVTGTTFEVKPTIVINATGPWIDFANRALQKETRFIGGTKGSHLVVDHPQLHALTQGHELFFENEDGRITLFFPIEERVLIGTTDIRIDNPDDAVCTESEIDYMLRMVKVVFPNVTVERSDIVFTFAGVRPLPASNASTTGQISRDHRIRIIEAGEDNAYPILSLVGGKWTTFRAFSEQTTDEVLKRLNKSRLVRTENIPIGGGKGYSDSGRERFMAEGQAQYNLSRERLGILFDRYGTQAHEIATFLTAADDQPLSGHPDYTHRELVYLVQEYKVEHLDDLLLRRTLLAMLGYVDWAMLEEVASVIAESMGWSADDISKEIEHTTQILKNQHGVSEIKLTSASVTE